VPLTTIYLYIIVSRCNNSALRRQPCSGLTSLALLLFGLDCGNWRKHPPRATSAHKHLACGRLVFCLPKEGCEELGETLPLGDETEPPACAAAIELPSQIFE
jgi:hypothetical protein